MRNAKKTLSLMMIAIFTTFIVLSGIPAGAAVTKAQATATVKAATAAVVKAEASVKATGFNTNTAKKLTATAATATAGVKKLGKAYNPTYLKLVARYQAVNKKIAAVIAALNKVYTDAEKAVTAAEKATDGDLVDLVGDEAALANAQGAVTAALEFIVALDQNSANYKGLMARIDAANNLIVKAMDEIAANQAAADKEAADKAAAEAAAKAEADAIAAADTAVKAVEVATDAAIALDLGKVAATKVAAVKTAEKVAEFTARLKVVADKFTPATIASVSAVDGTITVTFNKKPLTTPAAADFTVKKTVTTDSAVTTPVAFTMTVVSDTAVTLAVPAVVATTTAQAVLYSVAYGTGTAVPAAAAYSVAKVPALTVVSATATNLQQVLVTFSGIVDKTTAETVANYTVTDVTPAKVLTVASATVQADGKSVLVALKDAADGTKNNFANNGASATIAVANVKNAVAEVMTASTTSFVVMDATLPTVTAIALTGPKSIKLTFSEPVKTSGTVVVDSGAYVVTVPTIAAGGVTTLTVTTGANLVAGAHTVKVAGFVDYANFASASQTLDLTVAVDTTVPTVTIKSITQTGAVLQFSKAVTIGSGFTVYTTVNKVAAYGTTLGTISATDNTLVVTFANPLPAGAATLYVNNTTSTSTGTIDTWSNLLAETTTLTGSVVIDVTKPTVTAALVTDSNTQIDVTASETVTGGLTAANYSLKDAAGTTVAFTLSNPDTNVYRLTTAPLGGTYTLTVTGLKDAAVTPNTMDSYTTPIVVADIIKPIVTGADNTTSVTTYFTQADAKHVRVYFSEAMNITDLTTLALYQNSADNAAPTAAAAASNGKSVYLTFASNVATLTVGQLRDAAGNKMAALATALTTAAGTNIGLDTTVTPNVVATGLSTIKVYLNDMLTAYQAADFQVSVDGAGTWTTPSLVNIDNASGKSVLTMTLATAAASGAWDTAATQVQVRTTGAAPAAVSKNTYGIPVNLAATNVVSTVAPTLASTNGIVTKDVDLDGKIDHIVLTFSEKLNLNFVSADKFTVAGYTVVDAYPATVAPTSATARTGATVADSATVYVRVTELSAVDSGATPAVTIAAGMKDLYGNALAAVAATTSVDKTAAVVKTQIAAAATILGTAADTTHTLVFSEAISDASKTAIKAVVDAAYTVSGTSTVSSAWGTDNMTLTVTITPGAATPADDIVLGAIANTAVTDLATNASAALDLQQ